MSRAQSIAAATLAVLGFCGAVQGAEPPALLIADHSLEQVFIRAADGRIVWTQPAPHLYEAWMLPDGSVVFNTSRTVERIMPDLAAGTGGETRWIYRFGSGIESNAVPSGNIYTCTPVPSGRILITESGTYRLVELDADGVMVRIIRLPHPDVESAHPLRMTRLTPAGTYLVAYFAEGRFLEIDYAGKPLREIGMAPYCKDSSLSAYEAVSLPDGRLLISCGTRDQVIILNPAGQVEWSMTRADLPANMVFGWVAQAAPQKNGNIIVCNFCDGRAETLAFEITPEKELVWQLRDPRLKGVVMVQPLRDDLKPLDSAWSYR